MTRKLIYLVATLCVALAAYEAYAVAVAYKNLSHEFEPYESKTLMDIGLSEERKGMLVKIQDPSFFEHTGIEWPSPLTTTTITQSLVKKLFFEKFTKGFKKIEQTLIARFVVHSNISKETQLVAFVSTAYFGEMEGKRLFGISEGARSWFDKLLPELTDDEYLSLIAMLPAPDALKPGTAASEERVGRIKKVLSGECIYEHVSRIFLDQCS
ncbi:transglycosylase domain-containing protein [Spongiibacter tropicus]|uniref:transglycosylase domain-containing protein n=1 Tax=Spongiibacter tropicus TaxID=454602 RepID=UPI0003B55A53|nr:transglycosylase domain-containing protein [Spongiibacter tropicus]